MNVKAVDRNVKLQMFGLMIMSVIGALLELIGVSALLPIIDLAVSITSWTISAAGPLIRTYI